jgi:hypothetical protein
MTALNILSKQGVKCEKDSSVGFEVLTAVVMKSSVFLNTTPSSPLKVNKRFGGTHRLHLQDLRVSQAGSKESFALC